MECQSQGLARYSVAPETDRCSQLHSCLSLSLPLPPSFSLSLPLSLRSLLSSTVVWSVRMPTQRWQGGSLPTEWWSLPTSPCISSERGTLLLNEVLIIILLKMQNLLQTSIFIGCAVHIDVLPPFHYYDYLLCLAYKTNHSRTRLAFLTLYLPACWTI